MDFPRVVLEGWSRRGGGGWGWWWGKCSTLQCVKVESDAIECGEINHPTTTTHVTFIIIANHHSSPWSCCGAPPSSSFSDYSYSWSTKQREREREVVIEKKRCLIWCVVLFLYLLCPLLPTFSAAFFPYIPYQTMSSQTALSQPTPAISLPPPTVSFDSSMSIIFRWYTSSD